MTSVDSVAGEEVAQTHYEMILQILLKAYEHTLIGKVHCPVKRVVIIKLQQGCPVTRTPLPDNRIPLFIML